MKSAIQGGWVVLALAVILSGCARLPGKTPPVCRMTAVSDTGALPQFVDDASRTSLNRALDASISFWRRQDSGRRIRVCDRAYRAGRLLDSLLTLQKMARTLPPTQLSAAIGREFSVYQAQNSGGGNDILVTGYFQPLFAGSLQRRPPYIYPIYALPPDLISSRVCDASGKSQTRVGRLENGRLQPYWRRSEIEDRNLLAGHELLYLRDPFDAFVLQVQGSGLVALPDGSRRQVLYAGSNGWSYKSIGRLLVAEGRLPLAAVNMAKIRQYLFSHLDERRHILHYNDRYIFFRLAPATGEEPLGAMGRALTPGRSVALDAACFPLGSLAYLATEVPRFAGGRLVGWHNMRRFVLAQDRGAAIRGSGRLDMFWGHGSDAGKIAGEMRQPGKLYILIKKQGAAL